MAVPHAASRKHRLTIGGVMIAIAAIAVVLAALRPLARVMQSVYPAVSELIIHFATVETGVVLSCLVLGGYVTLWMMGLDEKT